MKVITLRRNFRPVSFGYETSQIYRHQILSQEGIDNEYLVTTPFLSMYWWLRIAQMGFQADCFKILPHLYSDLSDRKHTMTVEAFEHSIGNPSVLNTSDSGTTYQLPDGFLDTIVSNTGHVLRAIKRNSSLQVVEDSIVTEGLFYTDYRNGHFAYFNKDGSLSIQGETNGRETYYRLPNQSHIQVTEADLVIDYLGKTASKNLVIINDQLQERMDEVVQFCEGHSIRYYDFLHYDKYYSNDHRLLANPKPVRNNTLVASPYIIDKLKQEGIETRFVNPIGVEPSRDLPNLTCNRFVLIGNFTRQKRINMAIEAFSLLPELTLDIYGGTLADFQAMYPTENIPENVHFKGMIASKAIRHQEYMGYLSCSETEMYANSLVESLGAGLLPILSDVDFAHSKTLRDLQMDTAFTDTDSLVAVLKRVAELSLEAKTSLAYKILAYAENFNHAKAKESLLQVLTC
ncbi:glycosyltransferase [Streptococcus acidominimus]|uniref:Glycosyltransferase n=1 Tax=Streptococcus acidominimus TaxID=1326 RepID=A0A239WMT5_STRAI|nr:glycosyltransferase [Streptococcus acidominimus]SNV34924.1 glycosyltransferase [Streptococcus acidominimus]